MCLVVYFDDPLWMKNRNMSLLTNESFQIFRINNKLTLGYSDLSAMSYFCKSLIAKKIN